MSDEKKILLAEDDPNDVELILHALAIHQLENDVKVVSDGEEALNYLFRKPPYDALAAGQLKLIMLDLKMPKVDGLEVLKKIKSSDVLKMTPVVMLTSSPLEDDIARAYAYGANAYITKPVEFGAFAQTVSCLGLFWGILNNLPKRV